MRVLLADDQQQVRSALRVLLELEPNVQIVGEAADSTGLLLAVARKESDLVLLDWELPGLPPDQLVRFLRYEHPSLSVVGMSSRPDARTDALGAGVDDFVCKGDAPENLLAALRCRAGSAEEPNETYCHD